MAKSYWFKHDYNARSDKKMAKLLMEAGIEGVGIYWCIIEMLYEENGYLMLSDCERIAFALRTKPQKIKKVIDSELFFQDSEKFWSKSVLQRLGHRSEISNKARQAALIKWERNANALQTDSDRYAIREDKIREDKIRKKGVNFSEDFKFVFFDDESKQPLGKEQYILAKDNCLKPFSVIKGHIY